MNPLAPYLGIAKIIAVLAFAVGLLWTGRHYGAQGVQAEWDKEKREEAEMALAKEREIRRAFDTVTTNNRKEKERAKITINSLRSDVRNGTERLSVTIKSRRDGDAGTGTGEERAELLPDVSDQFLQGVGEANQAMRERNECIDKYNSIRGLIH